MAHLFMMPRESRKPGVNDLLGVNDLVDTRELDGRDQNSHCEVKIASSLTTHRVRYIHTALTKHRNQLCILLGDVIGKGFVKEGDEESQGQPRYFEHDCAFHTHRG